MTNIERIAQLNSIFNEINAENQQAPATELANALTGINSVVLNLNAIASRLAREGQQLQAQKGREEKQNAARKKSDEATKERSTDELKGMIARLEKAIERTNADIQAASKRKDQVTVDNLTRVLNTHKLNLSEAQKAL